MKHLLFIALLLSCLCCKAQTLDEWVHQRKTQIEYLEEQIIAMHVYGNYLQDGYNIVQSGLSAIHDIKNGDFTLHNNYFSSLKNVNPSVFNDSKTAGIVNLQLQLLQLNAVINKALKSNAIHDDERMYVKEVLKAILQQCTDNIVELTNLTTYGQSTMKDHERIKRIDAIYDAIKDRYLFTAHFKDQVALLALSRQKESGNIGALQSLYNTK